MITEYHIINIYFYVLHLKTNLFVCDLELLKQTKYLLDNLCELKLYCRDNTMKVMLSLSVYLTALLLGRLSPLSD